MSGFTSVGVEALEESENSGAVSLRTLQDPNEGNPQGSSKTTGFNFSNHSHNGPFTAMGGPFDIFDQSPRFQDTHTPPRVIRNIFQAFPSVAGTFPEWPFEPKDPCKNPQIKRDIGAIRDIKIRQNYGQELYMTRLFAPGTAAHRLFGNFNGDVTEFRTEYEYLQKNGFQPSEAYVPGTNVNFHNIKFQCSICGHSPGPKDWPNWLFHSKENNHEPRFLYCLRCKGGDTWAGLKTFNSLSKVAKDIASLHRAEEQMKQQGLGDTIISVPMAKLKRYCIMFDIEVQAAMVRRLLDIYRRVEAEKKRRRGKSRNGRSQAMASLNHSYSGMTAAQAIMDRYFTSEVPELLNTPGPLCHPDQSRSTTTTGFPSNSCLVLRDSNINIRHDEGEENHGDAHRRSTTPDGWPMGYFPTSNTGAKVSEVPDETGGTDSSTFPERPTTPVWFAARPRNPSPESDHSTSTVSDVIGLYDTSEDDGSRLPSSAGSSFISLGELSNGSFLSSPAVSSESLPGVINNENSRPSSSCPQNGESNNPATNPRPLQTPNLRRTPSYANNLHSLGTPNSTDIKPDRSKFYQCRAAKKPLRHGQSRETLANTNEAESDHEVSSSLDDISVDWDSDGSFDEPPRRLKCLDTLDEMFPPVCPIRREIEEAISKYDDLPQPRRHSWRLPKWKNLKSRPVDKSLLAIGEEEDEEEKKQEEKERAKGKGKEKEKERDEVGGENESG